MRVSNGGQPLGTGTPRRPGGMGTQIMNYRTKTIGGTLGIEHPAGGGAVLNCRVPHGPQPPGPAQQTATKH